MARGIKTVELNKRDRFVLFLLVKFRVLDTKAIAILADFPSESYCSTRLQKLAKYGYINREKLANALPLVHWLTQKGNDEINDKRTKHKPRLATLEHELEIGHVASFLCLQYDVTPKAIITDRELRQYEREVHDVRVMDHKGDLLFFDPQSRTKIVSEVELTFKGKSRTVQNIRKNAKFNDKQMWFIRKTMRGLEKTLLSEGIPKEQIIYLENIDLERTLIERNLDMDIDDYSATNNISSYFKRSDKPQESRLERIVRERSESTKKSPEQPKHDSVSFFDRFR
ncbi:rep protein [Streptococcus pluranimalium]|uniref:rep protein n=1 Tax=Streptococcus pluranimalium TaxID=82348 RepID=UPI003F66531C